MRTLILLVAFALTASAQKCTIQLQLLTGGNPECISMTEDSINATSFDATRPTKFILPDCGQSIDSPSIQAAIKKLTTVGNPNIIFVNWDCEDCSEVSKDTLQILAKTIAQTIDWLVSNLHIDINCVTLYTNQLLKEISDIIRKNVLTGTLGINFVADLTNLLKNLLPVGILNIG